MKARLIESHEIAPNVRTFAFETPDVQEFRFAPGQFVSFNQELNGRKITRPYSIASAPDGNRFEICLNLVEEGVFTPYLFSLQPDDELEVSAALGYFVLKDPVRDSVFVATGTGVAPFRSILKANLGPGFPHRITLLFGVRHERNLYYRGEFEQMALEHPNFRFHPTLSRPGEQWTGRIGHVQAHLTEALEDRRDVDVYICGLKLMVDGVRAILRGLGFDRKQVVYEKYD